MRAGPDFRTCMQKREQTNTKLPASLYCFVENRMEKPEIQILCESYIMDKLDTAQPQGVNRRTEPIKNACYILEQNLEEHGTNNLSAKQETENCKALRLSDDMPWNDHTRGKKNVLGDVIYHRTYYRKTPKASGGKTKYNYDINYQKHIFTLNTPYNFQVIQYLGNFETQEQYETRTEPEVLPDPSTATPVVDPTIVSGVATPVVDPTIVSGVAVDVDLSGDVPGTEATGVPSEEDTDHEHAVGIRRYRQPRLDDDLPKEIAIPRYDHNRKLSIQEADDVIESYHMGSGKTLNGPDTVITGQKPGDVYVFDIQGVGDWWKDTILKDTYSWGGQNKDHYDSAHCPNKLTRILQSCKIRPKAGPKDSKLKKPNTRFQRLIYYDLDDRKIAVVQYLGSNDGITPVPHGNTRSTSATPYVATSAQVKFDINKVGLTKKPKKLLDTYRCNLPPGRARSIKVMRNTKQINYLQAKMRREVNFTSGKMANIMAVANELPDFVRVFDMKPTDGNAFRQFVMIVAVEETIVEVRTVLKEIPLEQAITLGADTTFELACNPGCYATPLYLRHPYIERRTIGDHQTNPQANICVAIMFHDCKHLDDHQKYITEFHRIVDQELPTDANYRLSQKDINFLSDAELKNVKRLFGNTPKPKEGERKRVVTHYPCWLHLKDNVKRKFRNMGVTDKPTLKRAMDDFIKILKSDSLDEYEDNRINLRLLESPWSTSEAQEYFDQHLDERIFNAGATFRLRAAGFPNPENGITNNASESINATLKRDADHQKQEIPDLMLNIYFHMRSQAGQIEEAYYGMGEYKVSEGYEHLVQPSDAAPPQVYKTVEEMKKFLVESLATDAEDGLSAEEEAELAAVVPPETTSPPTIEKIAKLIWQNGNIKFSQDDQGVLLVRSLDRSKVHRVNLVDHTCDCGDK